MLHVSCRVLGLPTTRTIAAAGWRYHRPGKPSQVLKYEHFRIPFDRTSGQVVVKMLAAPVHRQDKRIIEGYYDTFWRNFVREAPAYVQGTQKTKSSEEEDVLRFPRVAGLEGVGVVEEVGSGVTLGLKPGDFVWVNNPSVGCWTTHLVTDADNLDVMPNRADVDIEHLASLSLFHTAYHLTNSFVSLQPNDVVLQTGASSSIAQICQGYIRAKGAKLFQTMQLGRTDHLNLIEFYKLRGAFAVVPYGYVRTNYMRRLLSDIPPPKLLLNHTCGSYTMDLVRLLGDRGVCVTYGNMTNKPMQIANMEFIHRGIQFRGFFLPRWIQQHSREARMRVHQNVIESMTISQGHGIFRAQRFKMDLDAPFAFSNGWDAPLTSRKAVLRMVGEYGEWRKPGSEQAMWSVSRSVWDDMMQEMMESQSLTTTPQSMKYYTPFADIHKSFFDPEVTKKMGFRDAFFRRPNAPRHNASDEAKQNTS